MRNKWRFDDKIDNAHLDFDIPINENWQTPRSLTLEGTLTLYYSDERLVINPTSEEVLEWVTDTQIPVYVESEDKT